MTRTPVKFLDLGCGNGYNTTQIWHEFYQRNLHERTQIYGIDPDKSLLEIASEEFIQRLAKITKKSPEELVRYQKHFPTFQEGEALKIPFEDDFFDVVYASQVLHWTDSQKAIREMLRVTRKGGKVCGTEKPWYPAASRYNDLHFKVVKGAHGLFRKEDLVKWAHEAGARKVKIATPIAIFELIK